MKILVTGANGFVGKNLISQLKNIGYSNIYEVTRETDSLTLEKYVKDCQFVFHLAGINRPKEIRDFTEGNEGFTKKLLQLLKNYNNKSPIVFSSSIHAEKDDPYGNSKRACEELLFSYSRETGVEVFIYRLPNLFGKWCRPNYNSVVATFCYKIARNEPIEIHDRETVLTMCYIVDVLDEFIEALNGEPVMDGKFCVVPVTHTIKLGELADKLYSFKASRESLILPSLEKDFDRALYSTFLSYLEEEQFSYPLKKNIDHRGWLAEFIKSKELGQIFISKTKPGVIRGNHWHHTKAEKFLVIQGEAIIRFRKIDSTNVIEYHVNGETPEVVDIPVGYTHCIENTGEDDVITLFWASEVFDPEKSDTYFLEV